VLVVIVYSNARVSLTGASTFLAYDARAPQVASVRRSLAYSRLVSTKLDRECRHAARD